jgi:hypothetical protein
MDRESVDGRARTSAMLDDIGRRYPVLVDTVGLTAGELALRENRFVTSEEKIAFIMHAMSLVKQAIAWLEEANSNSPLGI